MSESALTVDNYNISTEVYECGRTQKSVSSPVYKDLVDNKRTFLLFENHQRNLV